MKLLSTSNGYRSRPNARTIRLSAAFLTVALAALFAGATARAGVPPTNDSFADATLVASFPFTDTVADTASLTTESDEPLGDWPQPDGTVWYRIDPSTDTLITADTSGSYYSRINVYEQTGSGFAGLSYVTGGAWGPSLVFKAQGGATYYLQAGTIYSQYGSLTVNIGVIPPPANDNFADATVVKSLPFSGNFDTRAASTEPNEPTPSCGNAFTPGSVWYAFTPAASGSISAHMVWPYAEIAAYTGSSLAGLTGIGCAGPWDMWLTFHANAGTTYYFQVGSIWDQTGQFTFYLDVAPPPQAHLGLSPTDPSRYDTVQFYDQSSDPAYAGITSVSWSFGDGATSTDTNPTHRFAADGEYTVTDTITTRDGRTATTSQVVHVRTHDVAITRIDAPTSAHVGQKGTINVKLSNKHYPENVQIELYKSSPNSGWQQIGWQRVNVPVTSGQKTRDIPFTYTFMAEDAAAGKVSFQTNVSLVDARDALPADNTAISPPTKVTR
jgi:PKD domain